MDEAEGGALKQPANGPGESTAGDFGGTPGGRGARKGKIEPAMAE
jgi:hypothetical protein